MLDSEIAERLNKASEKLRRLTGPFKFGIEFEYSWYDFSDDQDAEDDNLYHQMCNMMTDHGDLHSDGSLRTYIDRISNIDRYDMRCTADTKEWASGPFNNTDELFDVLRDLYGNEKVKVCSSEYDVNAKDKKVNIVFNEKTGMHIHFSSDCQKDVVTRNMICNELKAFRNSDMIQKMKTICYNNDLNVSTDYMKSIRKHYERSFANGDDRLDIKQRRRAVNVSNSKGHGTIEFRLFNLLGIKSKEDMYNAVAIQLTIMFECLYESYTNPRIIRIIKEMDMDLDEPNVNVMHSILDVEKELSPDAPMRDNIKTAKINRNRSHKIVIPNEIFTGYITTEDNSYNEVIEFCVPTVHERDVRMGDIKTCAIKGEVYCRTTRSTGMSTRIPANQYWQASNIPAVPESRNHDEGDDDSTFDEGDDD